MPIRLSGATPKPRYPKQFKHLGDHIRAKRIESGLLQQDAARRIGVTTLTITNWELGRTEPENRHVPAIIRFVGYDPLPKPRTTGEHIMRARLLRGWSKARLAREAGIDEATVRRVEADTPGLARRSVGWIRKILGC